MLELLTSYKDICAMLIENHGGYVAEAQRIAALRGSALVERRVSADRERLAQAG